MAEQPTICFRCTEEFRNAFVGTAKTRGTTGQKVLRAFAEVWLRDPSALARAEDETANVRGWREGIRGVRTMPDLQSATEPATTLTDETPSMLAETESLLSGEVRELRAEIAALRAEISANRRARGPVTRADKARQKPEN